MLRVDSDQVAGGTEQDFVGGMSRTVDFSPRFSPWEF